MRLNNHASEERTYYVHRQARVATDAGIESSHFTAVVLQTVGSCEWQFYPSIHRRKLPVVEQSFKTFGRREETATQETYV